MGLSYVKDELARKFTLKLLGFEDELTSKGMTEA